MSFGWRSNVALAAVALSCSRPAAVPPDRSAKAPRTSAEAESTLALLRASEPDSFKMLHQVAARYQDQTWLMTGYLLARKDGAFRVSATAAVGPKLFDVAKVNGKWEARVHLSSLAERLDPKHVGRDVERIYFLDASGSVNWEGGHWVSRSHLSSDDDVDTIEVWRHPETLAVLHKRFLKEGKAVVEISYEKLERVEAHWIARRVRLVSTYGYSLDLDVTGYEPNFPVPDGKLQV